MLNHFEYWWCNFIFLLGKRDVILTEGGSNSYTGHGIHVPARIMGQFAVFCPGYGSCFVNFALVMGLPYGDLQQLWINVSNL